MMQKMLFLKNPHTGEIDRLINIDLLATAYPGENGGTKAIVGSAQIQMGMEFPEFMKAVEHLIAENYRISNEESVRWYQKKMADTEEMMKEVIRNHS